MNCIESVRANGRTFGPNVHRRQHVPGLQPGLGKLRALGPENGNAFSASSTDF